MSSLMAAGRSQGILINVTLNDWLENTVKFSTKLEQIDNCRVCVQFFVCNPWQLGHCAGPHHPATAQGSPASHSALCHGHGMGQIKIDFFLSKATLDWQKSFSWDSIQILNSISIHLINLFVLQGMDHSPLCTALGHVPPLSPDYYCSILNK